MSWDLARGQELLSWLQGEILPIGWCCGLTGSVLYNGESEKDLDIILYPMGVGLRTTIPLLKFKLKQLGFKCILDEQHVKMKWLVEENSRDTKHVEIWDFAGYRVDFFFLA